MKGKIVSVVIIAGVVLVLVSILLKGQSVIPNQGESSTEENPYKDARYEYYREETEANVVRVTVPAESEESTVEEVETTMAFAERDDGDPNNVGEDSDDEVISKFEEANITGQLSIILMGYDIQDFAVTDEFRQAYKESPGVSGVVYEDCQVVSFEQESREMVADLTLDGEVGQYIVRYALSDEGLLSEVSVERVSNE